MCCCKQVCPNCWGAKGHYVWQSSGWWVKYPNTGCFPSWPNQRVWRECWRCNGTGFIPSNCCCHRPINIVVKTTCAPLRGNAKIDIERARDAGRY